MLESKRLYLNCHVDNVASYKVLGKLGMSRVGLIKNHKVVKGENRDSYRYEITRPLHNN